MDLVSSCKDKLAYFRIKELKDVLTQLGLPKQGKKQDLVDRILSLLSDEQQGSKSLALAKKISSGKDGVAKIIDDTYRKMQIPGATDLASKSQSSSDISPVKPKEEVKDSYQLDMKVRCPCGSSLHTESMIKCEDQRCQVWQHIDCVIIPEKPMEGVTPEVPQHFYCELCRLSRADPFWLTVAQPLLPAKLVSSGITSDGANALHCFEKTYPLSRTDKELLQRTEYDLQEGSVKDSTQFYDCLSTWREPSLFSVKFIVEETKDNREVWCILLNDKVPFRMQWPQHADVQVNGIPVRTTNRPGSQLLGINGRDDGPLITTCSREGINKISLSRCDARTFSFGIRIAKRRTVQQLLNMVPKEADGERFEDALARVCRCISGGNDTDNIDSDSDLEVVADSISVNLRCPMSGSRIKIAGRFKPCVHMGCFDLEAFVELNQRSRKWQCPICLKNYSLENIIIDPYFNRITSLMINCGEDVNEIDVKPDGSWRAKNEGECRDLARWHLPDGSLCAATNGEVKQGLVIPKHVKQEDISDGHTGLKIGIRKNHNGVWELSKPESSSNHFQNLMPMSRSASESYKDGEDQKSVSKDDGCNFDISMNNIHELDYVPLNFNPTYDIVGRIPSAPSKDTDVIVLSDSDEDDNVTLVSANTNGLGIPFNNQHPGFEQTYNEDPTLRTNGISFGPYTNDNDEFAMPLWQLPTYSQAGSTIQLFGQEANGSDALIEEQGNSIPPVNGFNLTSNGGLAETSQAQDTNTEPLAYGTNDPSLQIFLPSQPAHSPQADLNSHTEMANGDGLDSWISLSLGGAGRKADSRSTNCLNQKPQFTAQENDTASLLLSMNGSRGHKATSTTRKSEGPFSHPRQPRSVRPRLYFSIDSESD